MNDPEAVRAAEIMKYLTMTGFAAVLAFAVLAASPTAAVAGSDTVPAVTATAE